MVELNNGSVYQGVNPNVWHQSNPLPNATLSATERLLEEEKNIEHAVMFGQILNKMISIYWKLIFNVLIFPSACTAVLFKYLHLTQGLSPYLML